MSAPRRALTPDFDRKWVTGACSLSKGQITAAVEKLNVLEKHRDGLALLSSLPSMRRDCFFWFRILADRVRGRSRPAIAFPTRGGVLEGNHLRRARDRTDHPTNETYAR